MIDLKPTLTETVSAQISRLRKMLPTFALVAMACTTTPGYALLINEVEGNNSVNTAQNVDAYFSAENDPLIAQSTEWPHVSILGQGNFSGDRDFFSFTATAGSMARFDIDQGMPDLDPWINLYTATGTLLWSQDDGGMIDPGSSHAYDSYGTFTFATSGLYVVSVQRWPDLGMEIGQNYRLQLSVENHPLPQAVPEPGSLALLGLGVVGLAMAARKRHKASA
jgi:Bacterial pre-peptidase C-terminal domain/PEP-CTERM motif